MIAFWNDILIILILLYFILFICILLFFIFIYCDVVDIFGVI